MKRQPFLIFFILLYSYLIMWAQAVKEIPLTTKWKFTLGDSLQFARPEYDDHHWPTISISTWWDRQGFPRKAGYAWYRLRVYIPSTIREEAYLKDSLVFYLGKIDDFDQFFLNGYLVGENTHSVPLNSVVQDTFSKLKKSYWNVPRRYALSVDDPRIRWDAENVIAVRVYNWGGPGGMFGSDQRIAMADLSEYVQLQANRGLFYREGNQWKKIVTLLNRSRKYAIDGQFRVRIRDNIQDTWVWERWIHFHLEPEQHRTISLLFPVYDQSSTLYYSIAVDHSSKLKLQREGIPYLLTPMPPPEPEINPPYVYGQRPGHPFLFRLPVSGKRPMVFKAQHLPRGLTLQPRTGIITGQVEQSGTYSVKIIATNAFGSDSATIRIVIGDELALTPPMGWNSWNVWGLDVSQQHILQAARALVDLRLVDYGWQFVNLDDGWEIPGNSTQPGRTPDGEILTNEKFPDMKVLADSIHALGLKFGIYSSPGPLTCGGFTGSYGYEQADARTFARWGVDFLKYDLCHYRDLMHDVNDPEELKPPYLKMYRALQQVPRDIVYSICEYGNGRVWEWGREVGGNLWRTTGDIWDEWDRVAAIGFNQDEAAPYAGPGHWNDPDMLVIGWVGWGKQLHYTRLTPDEQYTHVSLWSLLAAPLLLGCDLQKMDAFTYNLISNPEVLAINQDPLGYQARTVWEKDSIRAYTKKLADGDMALGLFNLSQSTRQVIFPLSVVGIQQPVQIRDVWRRQPVGSAERTITTILPPHGVYLVKLIRSHNK